MAQVQEKRSAHRADNFYVQYLPLSPDGAATSEPLREDINRNVQRGWRLAGVYRHPDGLEVVWDKSGSWSRELSHRLFYCYHLLRSGASSLTRA
jgi:hypothetical protein